MNSKPCYHLTVRIRSRIHRYHKIVAGFELPYPSEIHVYNDRGAVIPATRGKYTPRAISSVTFRSGPEHIHPPGFTGNGNDHSVHIFQDAIGDNRANNLITLFKRRVVEVRNLRKMSSLGLLGFEGFEDMMAGGVGDDEV
jgi:hypothetical protein